MKTVKTLITMVTPTPEIEALFDPFGDRVDIHFIQEGEAVADFLDDLEVLYGTLEQRDFHRARCLRWMQTNSTGIDHVSYPEFMASEILLTNTGRSITTVVADSTIGLILTLARNLHHQRDLQREHRYEIVVGRDVGAMVLGILGLGKIGAAIAERAATMVREIHAMDVRALTAEPPIARAYGPDQLDDILGACDAVICALPLTPQTDGLFADRQFQLMKRDAYFINICRGEVVDEEALLRALRRGEIAGAAIDVLREEPCPPDSPLWDEPNLLLTPHCIGYCENLEWRKMRQFAENMKHYLESGTIPMAIDKTQGW